MWCLCVLRMVKHIDEFEVYVDVDDRMTMYDYATCRFVHRSPQDEPGWNPAQLALLGGTDHIDKHDENMMMQVHATHMQLQGAKLAVTHLPRVTKNALG